MSRRLLPWLVAALILAFATPVSALVLQRFSLADLVARSVAVVRGVVRGSEARWDADHARIHTTWKVEVSEAVYGAERGQVLSVITLGGRVGDVVQQVPGNVRLSEGEDVFLFLVPNGDAHSIAGTSQGKYTVVPGPAGGSARLVRDPAAAGSALTDGPTLDEMRTRVRALAKGVTR